MRELQKVYARMNGYFWLPCPICYRMFGGHEWHDIGTLSSTIYVTPTDPTLGTAICPVCTAQGKGHYISIKYQLKPVADAKYIAVWNNVHVQGRLTVMPLRDEDDAVLWTKQWPDDIVMMLRTGS